MMSEEKLRKLSAAIRGALAAAVDEYANGKKQAVPIVNRHFTPGNQQRYGWEPLSRDYFLAKQRDLGKAKVFFSPGGGKRKIKLDQNAGFQSRVGQTIGIGAGRNKPMLVNSGALRAAVNSGTHRIVASPDGSQVTVYFRNLPDYAIYLHEGTAKMPRRSPVQPNAEEYEQVYASARRYIDAVLRTGTTGPRAFNGAKARMV